MSDSGRIYKREIYPLDPLNKIEGFSEICGTRAEFSLLTPEYSIDGYTYIDNKDMPIPGKWPTEITRMDGTKTKGTFVHRMVVFSHGDKDGRPYTSKGRRCVVDHIDMDHSHNEKSNLQLVSHGINLWRAYDKRKTNNPNDTASIECERRFKEYYNSLDEIDKEILKMEISLDMQGKY